MNGTTNIVYEILYDRSKVTTKTNLAEAQALVKHWIEISERDASRFAILKATTTYEEVK